MANLGTHRVFIFRVSLNSKVNNRFLVFVLQKAKGDEGTSGVPLGCVPGDVLEIYGHSSPGLTLWRM